MKTDRHLRVSAARGLTFLFLFAVAGLLTVGCNILGPVAGVMAGRGTIEAQYTLKPDLPTLVYVDDRGNLLGRSSLRRLIADTAAKKLLSEKLVKDVVDSQGAMVFARREPPDRPYTVEELGEAVGAKQVVFVEIEGFGLTMDGSTLHPTALARVKVIEVGATPARVWPESPPIGFLMGADLQQQGGMNISNAERRALQDKLATKLGMNIAGLFYKHERAYVLEKEGK